MYKKNVFGNHNSTPFFSLPPFGGYFFAKKVILWVLVSLIFYFLSNGCIKSTNLEMIENIPPFLLIGLRLWGPF